MEKNQQFCKADLFKKGGIPVSLKVNDKNHKFDQNRVNKRVSKILKQIKFNHINFLNQRNK